VKNTDQMPTFMKMALDIPLQQMAGNFFFAKR